jgi:hypothetical protein
VPIVSGTPQMSGVPVVQGTPSSLNGAFASSQSRPP